MYDKGEERPKGAQNLKLAKATGIFQENDTSETLLGTLNKVVCRAGI